MSAKLALLSAILSALLVGCGDDAPGARASVADGMNAAKVDLAVSAVDADGRTVRLLRPARRIVSLLPAGTETLLALGAGERIVGRTRYDEMPEAQALPSVGGGLDPSLEALVSLAPDLVIAFRTAGGSPLRAQLEPLGIRVFTILPEDTAAILRIVHDLGRLTGRVAAADSLAGSIHADLDAVREARPREESPTVLYVASVDPPIIAGGSTYISELVGVAGGRLVGVPTDGPRWPQLSLEALVRLQPDIILLPVGPAGAASGAGLRSAPGWRELRAVREGRIVTVPAELMNRPGPAIGEAARVLQHAIHSAAREAAAP